MLKMDMKQNRLVQTQSIAMILKFLLSTQIIWMIFMEALENIIQIKKPQNIDCI